MNLNTSSCESFRTMIITPHIIIFVVFQFWSVFYLSLIHILSGNYGSESNIEIKSENNNNTIKNVVLESKVVNLESDNEDFVGVEFNNKVLVSVDTVSYTHLDVYKRQVCTLGPKFADGSKLKSN